MTLNLSVDEVLTTTRSVRKRLDLEKPVPRKVLLECLELAIQAPTGSNAQGWQWVFVEDADKKKALADIYRRGAEWYRKMPRAEYPDGDIRGERMEAVTDSALYLAEHLDEVPVLMIPCLEGRVENDATAQLVVLGSLSRRRGVSAWLCAPAVSGRAGRPSICSPRAKSRPPRCSASRTRSTARAGCSRSPTPRAPTSARPSGCRLKIVHWDSW